MAHRLTILVTVMVLAAAPAAAQDPATTTLRDIVAAMSDAREKANLAATMPLVDRLLEEQLTVLNGSGMLDDTADRLAAAVAAPRVAALARVRSGQAPPRVINALRVVKRLRNNEVFAALAKVTSPQAADQALRPVTMFQAAQLDLSLADSLSILRKYERKFGPDSARLNGPEVLLNYGLQRVRGFGPNAAGEPGPLELIASYSPTYLTYADDKAQMVSITEFGLRRYFFSESWGAQGWQGFIKPAFMTAGLAVAGEEDGAMKWPWKGDARLGAFLSWGELKVAYLFGDNQRVLISRQFQLIPFAF